MTAFLAVALAGLLVAALLRWRRRRPRVWWGSLAHDRLAERWVIADPAYHPPPPRIRRLGRRTTTARTQAELDRRPEGGGIE